MLLESGILSFNLPPGSLAQLALAVAVKLALIVALITSADAQTFRCPPCSGIAEVLPAAGMEHLLVPA